MSQIEKLPVCEITERGWLMRLPSKDCTKYYECDGEHKEPVLKTCMKGLLFNENRKVCDSPEFAPCGKREYIKK